MCVYIMSLIYAINGIYNISYSLIVGKIFEHIKLTRVSIFFSSVHTKRVKSHSVSGFKIVKKSAQLPMCFDQRNLFVSIAVYGFQIKNKT